MVSGPAAVAGPGDAARAGAGAASPADATTTAAAAAAADVRGAGSRWGWVLIEGHYASGAEGGSFLCGQVGDGCACFV